MQYPLRGFWITVAILWAVLCIAGYFYSKQQGIPDSAALAVILASLVEAAFYIAPGFASVRQRLSGVRSRYLLAGFLAVSALVPYVIFAGLSSTFEWLSFALLGLIAAVIPFWFAILPKHPATDLGFLALVAIVFLSTIFQSIYIDPHPRIPAEMFGKLMSIRLGIASALFLRGVKGTGFGFVPERKDWKIGILHYLYFLPVGAALIALTGFATLRSLPVDPAKLALTAFASFLGFLWVVALSEEFFVRGLLQQWLSKWMNSPMAGLLIASLIFGLLHLPFRSAFPNWRFALLAATASLFYGRAFQQAGSIRASMVTHALVVLTWRVFLV